MTLIETISLKDLPVRDKILYTKTILENPYIPFKPYPKQAIPLILLNQEEKNHKPNNVLTGAGGYGGKSYLGAMAAAQYLQEPDYTCLVTRLNYAELLDTNSIWENLVDWCCDSERLGDLACTEKKTPTPRIIAPNGNIIYFKAFDNASKKHKFKSASYDRIVNDEASELHPEVLTFQYRSMRNTSRIPRGILNLSNPGGDSTDYLVEKFVDGDNPYIALDWRDNPHIDRRAYEGSLNELDYIDQQYQKYGNWHYKPTSGELITYDELKESLIKTEDYNQYRVMFNVIGIDLAGKGRDRTSCTSLTLYENGQIILTDGTSTPSAYPEEMVSQFLETQYEKYLTNLVNYEAEPGSDSIYSLRHWQDTLAYFTIPNGIIVKDTSASHSKFNRARPIAREIRKGNIRIDENINKEWLEKLFDQFIYISPNPEVMKKQKSPDELDSLGYAYIELQQLKGGGVKVK